MSVAKKAVESTARRVLVYTAEIIMSIILLIILCLPLAFMIPMWVQIVALGTPRASVFLDPVVLFGTGAAFAITFALCILSVLIGYFYLQKLTPASDVEDEVEEVEAEEEELEIEEEVEIEEVTKEEDLE
ncbi:MAG: hypothetical protein EAX95_06450 [Candidatus Thorarchaeota archaeon]|nr:hypothetical protein [Candidatus Thorarchaeota archaeon]